MKLASDTIVHLKGGLLVLLGALVITAGCQIARLHWLPTLLIVAGFVAGASVEGSQQADNDRAEALGLPRPHEVSWRDMVASAAPCWAAAVAIELARYAKQLPAWLG